MKKLFFSLIATMFFSLIGVAQDLSKLSENKDFISYITNMYSLEKKIFEYSNQLEIESIEDEEDLNKFYEKYNLSSSEFETYVKEQNNLIKKIDLIFNIKELTSKQNIVILNLEIEEVYNLINSNNKSLGDKNCRKILDHTIQSNWAIAITGHAACTALDLSVIGGIICHGAVSYHQWNQNQLAYIAYDQCMKN